MNIAIIGLGLMGGSLALSLKKLDFINSIVGVDNNWIPMKFILFLLLSIFIINASAMTVSHINYKGLVHISEPVALRMLEFEVGDDVDTDIIDNMNKVTLKIYGLILKMES